MTSSTIRIKIKDEKHDYAKAIDVSPKDVIGDVAVGFADARGFADVPTGFTLKRLGAPGKEAFRVGHTIAEIGIKEGDVLELHQLTTIPRHIAPKAVAPKPEPQKVRRAGGGSPGSTPARRKRTAARPRKSAVRPENNGHSNIDLALEALDTIKDMARAVGPLTDVAAIARKLHEELAPTAFGHSDLIKDLGRALEQLDAGEAA